MNITIILEIQKYRDVGDIFILARESVPTMYSVRPKIKIAE